MQHPQCSSNVLSLDYVYNPLRFAKVSSVFGKHLRNLRCSAGTGEKAEEEGEEQEEEEEMYDWDSFVPRRVHLDILEGDDDDDGSGGPWSRYLATPETQYSRTPGKEFSYLSDSMVLLLQLCSDVVDVEATKLLLRVKYVEWTIIFASGAPVAPSVVSSSESSSSSDEELSEDEDSSGSECSSSFLSDCSCSCSECCQTCHSSSSSSSSCSISSCSGLDSVSASDSDS